MQIRNGVRENIVKTNLHQRQTFSANLVDYFYLGKIVDQTRRAAAQNKLSRRRRRRCHRCRRRRRRRAGTCRSSGL